MSNYLDYHNILYIHSDGKVGVNNNSPLATLSLASDQGNANGHDMIRMDSPDPTILFNDTTNTGSMRIRWQAGSGTSQGLRFFRDGDDGSNPQLMIDLNGRIGIGTSNPDARLHVDQSTNGVNDGLIISNFDTTAGTGQHTRLQFGLARNSGTLKSNAGEIIVGKSTDWTNDDNRLNSFMKFQVMDKMVSTDQLFLHTSGADFRGYVGTDEIRTKSASVGGGVNGMKINIGESYAYESVALGAEILFVNAETGIQLNTSPDNWNSGWAGRDTTFISGTEITINGDRVWHDGNVDNDDGLMRAHKRSITLTKATEKRVLRVTGTGYSSAIKIHMWGTTGNVVVNTLAEILVNHSLGIDISSNTGAYTGVTWRVVSDNDKFDLYVTYGTTGSSQGETLPARFAVYTYGDENVTFEPTATAYVVNSNGTNEHTHSTGSRTIYHSSRGGENTFKVDGRVGIGTTSPATPLHIRKVDIPDNTDSMLLTLDGKFVDSNIDAADHVGITFRVENSVGGAASTNSITYSYNNRLHLQKDSGTLLIGTENNTWRYTTTGTNYSSSAAKVTIDASSNSGSTGTNTNNALMLTSPASTYMVFASKDNNGNNIRQGYIQGVEGQGMRIGNDTLHSITDDNALIDINQQHIYMRSSNNAEPLATLLVDELNNHGGVVVNAPAAKQTHLRFQNNGTLKWQMRCPFHESTNPDSLRFYSWTKGGDVMTLKNNGFVGIGTSDPQAPLHVYDARTGNSEPNILVDGPANTERAIVFAQAGAQKWWMGIDNTGGLANDHFGLWNQAQSDWLIACKSDGKVGIGGTTTPTCTLTLGPYGATDGTRMLGFAENTADSVWFESGFLATNDDNYICLNSGSSTIGSNGIMTWKLGGNVGIGTKNPAYSLDVAGGARFTGESISNIQSVAGVYIGTSESNSDRHVSIVSPTTNNSYIDFSTTDADFGGRILYNHNNDKMNIYTSGTTRMTLDSVGNVGIGTQSPAAKFEVVGANGQLFSVVDDMSGVIFSVNDSSGIPSIEVEDDGTVTLAEFGGKVFIGTPTYTAALVNVGGTIDATAHTTNSDRALKNNIEPIVDAVDKVKQIGGYTFDMTTTGHNSTGVIAQEVEQVLPQVVFGEEGEKSVSYGNMVGLLIEAIKEQQQTIEAQQARIEALEQHIK